MQRRVDREQTEIGSLAARFDVNAACQAAVILEKQEFAFLEQRVDLGKIDPVAIHEKLLDAKGRVDQGGDRLGVRGFCYSGLHITTVIRWSCRFRG